MVDVWAYVDTEVFTQNDFCNNMLKFGTPYAEQSV